MTEAPDDAVFYHTSLGAGRRDQELQLILAITQMLEFSDNVDAVGKQRVMEYIYARYSKTAAKAGA